MKKKHSEVPTELPPVIEVTDEDENAARAPSEIAIEIERLKKIVTQLASDREMLPQPLFWSVFHSQLDEVRKKKELKRMLNKVFGDGAEE